MIIAFTFTPVGTIRQAWQIPNWQTILFHCFFKSTAFSRKLGLGSVDGFDPPQGHGRVARQVAPANPDCDWHFEYRQTKKYLRTCLEDKFAQTYEGFASFKFDMRDYSDCIVIGTPEKIRTYPMYTWFSPPVRVICRRILIPYRN